MIIGFALPVSGSWATPENCIEIAETAERLGYGSLWTFQRLLSPVTPDGQQWLPPAYHSVLDPLSVLSFAAARTIVISNSSGTPRSGRTQSVARPSGQITR
jgi:alkanesulfonate monooxygenase SsuD/methylene tetrahydromethanopterin reductase-like flavin-dependent oxidoreductase (luciferase family)